MTRGLAAACCAVLVGCSGGLPDRPAAAATVTLMMPIDQYGLSWHWSSQAQFLVFSPLVARNAAGELEPRLAASWDHSPDYRAWTVRLNTAARWHDGVPVTAEDVKFTLDLLANAEGSLTRDDYAVTVLDDSTYRIRYERPGIGSPLDDFTVIYPKHLLDTLDRNRWGEWDFWTAPVGSGPFRHVRTVEGFGFEFEANPDYFRGRPRIDRVVLKFGAPQPQLLLSGELDVLPYATELRLQAFKDDDRFVAYRWHNPVRMKAVLWNHRSALFRDARVRRALALGVDRREIVRAAGLPPDLPVFDGLYSERQLRSGDLPAAVPYDPDQAAALLEAAGWRDTDGDGVRDRGGLPCRFTLDFSGGTGSGWGAQGGEAVGIMVQDQLRRVGVDVHLQPLAGSVWRERLETGDFDAMVEDIASLPTRIWFFGTANYLGYENPRVAELLDRIGAAFDPDSVDHFYVELAGIFAEDHPALFLYPAVSTTIVHRRVRGLSSPYRADAVWYLEELWIAE